MVDCYAEGILGNEKDQGADNNVLDNIRVINSNRGVGHTVPDNADDDSTDNTAGVYLAGGPHWTLNNVTSQSDIFAPGFGTISTGTLLTINAMTRNADCTATTTGVHGLVIGAQVTFSGMPASWTSLNGVQTVTAVPSTTTFKFGKNTAAFSVAYSGTSSADARGAVICSNNVDLGGGIPCFNTMPQCVVGSLLYIPFTVTAASLATSCVLTTSVTHNYFVGDSVTLSNMPNGWETLNGTFLITAVAATTFTIAQHTSSFIPFSGSAYAMGATNLLGEVQSFSDVNGSAGSATQALALTGNTLVSASASTWFARLPGTGFYSDAAGKVTCDTGSATLTGDVDTLFQSKLAPGYQVYDDATDPPSLIGIVQSVVGAARTNLTTVYGEPTPTGGNISTTRGTGIGKITVAVGDIYVYGSDFTTGSYLHEGDFVRRKSTGELIGQIAVGGISLTMLTLVSAFSGVENLTQVKWKYFSEIVTAGTPPPGFITDGIVAGSITPPGDALYRSNNQYIGTVDTIQSETQLTLAGEPQTNVTSTVYKRGSPIIAVDDTTGVDPGDYIYLANGTTLIGVVLSNDSPTQLTLTRGVDRSITVGVGWAFGKNDSVTLTDNARKTILTPGNAYSFGILKKTDYSIKVDDAVTESDITPTCHGYGYRVAEKNIADDTIIPATFDNIVLDSGDATTPAIAIGQSGVGFYEDAGSLLTKVSTASTGSIQSVENITMASRSGTPAAGLGLGKAYTWSNDALTAKIGGKTGFRWVSAVDTAETSEFVIYTMVGGVLAEKVRVTPNGYVVSPQNTRVASIFSKTSDVTLANVTGLTVNVSAGKSYSFEATLLYTAGASGGNQYAIAGTATATAIRYNIQSVSDAGRLRVRLERLVRRAVSP